MTSSVDEGRAMNVIHLDFSKTFSTFSPNILKNKLLKNGLAKWIARWTEDWLNCGA